MTGQNETIVDELVSIKVILFLIGLILLFASDINNVMAAILYMGLIFALSFNSIRGLFTLITSQK